ncbi:MAG: methyltransferase [Bacteroidota bacterium]|nr:methyltransferase [Bacteroidota bacterium]
MKVCTDACIFGAWVAENVAGCKLPVVNCLDIGSGTGLLSLMFAQKNSNSIIDSVEIEVNAINQAKENFSNSPWKKRLFIFNADIKNFISDKKYDLIICNPPFFENDLKSILQNKNIAKHDEGLTLKELIQVIKNNLSATGYFAILLPYHRIKYFEELAEKNDLFLKDKLLVRQTPTHHFFRGILFFSHTPSTATIKKLTIKDKEGKYTEPFTRLLKDYYLKL